MFELKQEKEKFILIGAALTGGTFLRENRENAKVSDVEDSLVELAELVATAGGETVGTLIQNREAVDNATYFGKGKVEELKELIASLGATGIVCDDELSPAQLSNLEDALSVKVCDRTTIILDIFAQRASTKEGKIQVELAQLKYRQSHLIGLRSNLSRLGGGIGTRGPGESKLESDRRLISSRIAQLNKELKEVVKARDVARSQRTKANVRIAAIVGYTNAGKSTLLNTMTGADVLEEDKLFATLDPTVRELELLNSQKILLTDTVGFVRKLPHNIIDAFKSTLEEAKYADVIVQVVDASNPDYIKHMEVTYETLEGLGIKGKPFVTFFNKMDKVTDTAIDFKDLKADYIVKGSVKNKVGTDELIRILDEIIKKSRRYEEKLIPFDRAGELQKIRQHGQIISEEYREDGIFVKAYLD